MKKVKVPRERPRTGRRGPTKGLAGAKEGRQEWKKSENAHSNHLF